jgi:cysteine desulfurase
VVEHPAITACLRESDCDVSWVPCQSDGRVCAEDVIAAIRRDGSTALVTLMWANNETGAMMPVRQVALHCEQVGVAFHTDAAQACGKVDVFIGDGPESIPATMVTIVG